ncbi:TetR/AcrR family transcriptional regulator [Paractinoplanes lichenicola]|uniref:TetR/AcrR family transcriptional regulator n=1 Tax=Paractinoplanes lichenicola TaxID=2802976 RepID=A0ABS1VRW8_9ACTN|nr:TetR/AcrR family transcriptional regulator [Actinoplanes lichenicola]MBL7257454.1 TetR/AcrR family transcriptional regulator [Actinoplanes lichenicola]
MTNPRRAAIVSAAYRCMARNGYERTSTAQICREAGVSSGTFFHHFPTKAAVLVAVLEDAFAQTRAAFDHIRTVGESDALAALAVWRDHVLSEAADEDLAGFVSVLGSVPGNPSVTALLSAEATLTHDVLTSVIGAGQGQGVVRADWTPDRLATWLGIVADGVLSHAVEGRAVSAAELADVTTRLVGP